MAALKSLDSEGRWPWPRSKIARLTNILSEDGAKVISFDITFAEPDENTNLVFINQFDKEIETLKIKNHQLNRFIEKSKINADNDLTLAKALKNSKAKVVLGYFFHVSQADLNYHISKKEIEDQLKRISNSRYPLYLYDKQEDEEIEHN